MFAIAELTVRKMKEPAFFIMLLLLCLLGYAISDLDNLSQQLTQGSFVSQMLQCDDTSSQPLLASTCFAFAISLILASFWGAAEIPRDISSGLVAILLSKPIRKTQYMLGKYLGVLAMALVFFGMTELVIYVSHSLGTNQWYSPLLMLRQFYIVLAFIPFTAFVIALSCFVGDLPAMILTVLYALFSLFFNFIPIMFAMLPENIAADLETPIFLLYYCFPNYIFYFIDFKLFGLVFSSLILYSLSLAGIILSIAAIRLSYMDLNANHS